MEQEREVIYKNGIKSDVGINVKDKSIKEIIRE